MADKRLEVFLGERHVGTLALTADRKGAFEYTDEWIAQGFSISPFSLPLKKQVFIPQKDYFGGLFGVFADSLPDAWGAYDMTYSSTYYGEHTTTVDGNGRNPGEKELLAVGTAAGIKRRRCREITEQVKECVIHMLSAWL